jgi:anti-sigma factor RsiW
MALPSNPNPPTCGYFEDAMKPDPEAQIELDIDAYVNGQLDGERRFAVAEYLAAHPDRAAEVMAALRMTEGLRLALGTVETPVPAQLHFAAARVGRGLEGRQRMRRWLPFAAAAAMFAFGWTAQSVVSGPEPVRQAAGAAALFEAALDAQDAVSVRLSLSNEIGPMPQNAAEISARLGITLPELPKGWTIRAAQVVATPERPGLAIVIDTPDLGEIMLFSVLCSVDEPDGEVETASKNGSALAFFEDDRTAFVLVDNSGPLRDLRRGAEDLRMTLN